MWKTSAVIPKRSIAGDCPVFRGVTIALCMALAGGAARAAEDTPVERGKIFAQQNCARCHAIGMEGDSPYSSAPPFRILHKRYDVGDLAEALAEGLIVVHNGSGEQMPEFILQPDQIDDLIAFLRSLQPERSAGATLR
jgi:cytochrome c